jgi:hypothetical protein
MVAVFHIIARIRTRGAQLNFPTAQHYAGTAGQHNNEIIIKNSYETSALIVAGIRPDLMERQQRDDGFNYSKLHYPTHVYV